MNKFMLYRDKHGPFNASYRTELAIARAVSPFFKNVTPRDLLLWPVIEPVEADVKDVFAMIKSLATKPKSKANGK